MALPKLNVPRYSVKLPSTGKELSMRPYLVKEEKVLMIALESNDVVQISNAVKDVIQSCYEIDDMDELTMFDIEKLFLQLRGKSVGENMDIKIKCKSCDHMTPVTVNVDDVEVSNLDQDRVIVLDEKSGVGVKMRYPTVKTLQGVDPEKLNSVEGVMELIGSCMDTIFDEENVYDVSGESKEAILDFIDTLSGDQFRKIQGFFKESPAIVYGSKFKCESCKEENEFELKGLNSFFS